MLSQSIRNSILCDELQLGQTLNNNTHLQQRAQFHLLLSMLSADVCDQAQFDMLAQDEATQQLTLRQKFQLPPSEKFTPIESDYPRQAELSHPVNNTGDLWQARLQGILQLAPLSANDAVAGVAADVINNVDLITRLKHIARHTPVSDAPVSEKEEENIELKVPAMYQVLTNFDYDRPLRVQYAA